MNDSRAAIPDDIDGHLEDHGRTLMVTRRKDGSPTCHPMARFYADGEMYFNMYASSVKHRNLSRDPRVTCLVTTDSDDPDFRAVIVRGRARYLSPDETLAADASTAVRLARGIGMEGVTKVDDAPEKFAIEEPEDWLKRAAIMVERIRDGVRVLWEVVPAEVAWLEDVRRS
ncbi:MAG TPA: pyridoxamine 5'-phosphate oxidase family protein [Acidimicrobiales bacterium]|nr:pyridoxamine 5'-phosphate oxidase family protein [Acidimicrobiales bacterium]